MALPHAQSRQVINVRPLGSPTLADKPTHALIKASQLEIIRVVLPAGKTLPQHDTPGEITVHCLEGVVEFNVAGTAYTLHPGELIHLEPRAPHGLRALEDASLLVTICLIPAD